MVYKGINFYPSLKGKNLADFTKEVAAHNLSKDEIKEAFDLVNAPEPKAPADETKTAEPGK